MNKIKNYINGKLTEPASKEYFDSFEPGTGKAYAEVPDSENEDLEAAIEAAQGAFKEWARTPASERARLLNAIADEIDNQIETMAKAESVDNGKPISLARAVDIPRASFNFRFFASAITSFSSESHAMEDSAINYTLCQPIGIVGCISPWNLPLYLFTWKIAPALAVGNCVIGKPSEITPMSAYLLSEICMDVGLPAGVLNIVHGYGNKVGAAMSVHPEIPVISFTGGTSTGRRIAEAAAPHFKKLSLEMGGKNPNIIFADCDYETSLSTAVQSSFANQGQICLCGSRIIIESSIYDRFCDDLVDKTKSLVQGDPLEESTQQGAVVSEEHMAKIMKHIEMAKDDGGTVLTGGERNIVNGRCKEGWFIKPTVIEGLGTNCKINQEEVFGPVVTLLPFDSEEEALEIANSTDYGLTASIWTSDLSRAHRLAGQIEAGIVWINCWMLRDLRTPFGGVKNSGLGREGGWEALRFFTELKNVCVKI
ncbi:MAG TPA: aldehyde dehydrogenase [Candidatus Marinimicrobia bacterium]|nr:aldehyde dehydrogenase [Candidatus Neomarinimicrobiota bacterium]HIB03026.1 aldehyde dehydrogenase [Candidatus Neomarinimicrobiota bacterium]HIC74608.1 aldehyde dehydrogenase [Candidatus Neomarinimicrobiota bacterium]HIN61411.1 aldehyde dehydrogenase [Candidatus Neomarinimicrobiota bacterium]HIO89985.1 aldehyde dehydrogenase [Candidatus Neomarinimicrobiota bacterium]